MGAVVCSSSSYPVEPSHENNRPLAKPAPTTNHQPTQQCESSENRYPDRKGEKEVHRVKNTRRIEIVNKKEGQSEDEAKESSSVLKIEEKPSVDNQSKDIALSNDSSEDFSENLKETIKDQPATETANAQNYKMSEEQAENFTGVSPVALAEALSRIPRTSRSRLRSTPGRIETVRCWQEKRQEWRKGKYRWYRGNRGIGIHLLKGHLPLRLKLP